MNINKPSPVKATFSTQEESLIKDRNQNFWFQGFFSSSVNLNKNSSDSKPDHTSNQKPNDNNTSKADDNLNRDETMWYPLPPMFPYPPMEPNWPYPYPIPENWPYPYPKPPINPDDPKPFIDPNDPDDPKPYIDPHDPNDPPINPHWPYPYPHPPMIPDIPYPPPNEPIWPMYGVKKTLIDDNNTNN